MIQNQTLKGLIGDRWGSLGLKTKIGLGLGGAGLLGLAFSAKDDNYNTIEGLRHGGMAQGIRRRHTDFGSGYRGLPDSLMGQSIDRRILDYRKDVIESGDYKDVEEEIAERQKAQLGNIDSFRNQDFETSKSQQRRMEGLSAGQSKLRTVKLNQFNMEVEDADTLILRRKGLFNLFSNPIQIRLAGIDAPETAAHSGDPLAPVRYEQDQPMGEKASDVLRNLISEQDNISLKVGTEKTYGRYVGALVGDDSVLNVDLARSGAVAALPFGKVAKDVVSRGAIDRAQSEAQASERGIWSLARYKAIDKVQDAVGQSITFNTLSRVDKLAKNLSLGAYSSLVEGMGSEQRELTYEEENIASRIGRALRKTHGPRKQGYNKSEGLHPGSQGMGAQSIRRHSEFGSGWKGLLGGDDLAETGFEGYEEYESIKVRNASRRIAKALGKEPVEELPTRRPTTLGGQLYHTINGLVSTQMNNGQKFPGMGDDGMAAKIRGQLTEFKEKFASRWDPMRKIAREIFGHSKSSLDDLKNLPQFESAIHSALSGSSGKLLGTGATAKTFGYKGSMKYKGKTHEFDFVAKRARSVEDLMTGPKALSEESAIAMNQMTKGDFLTREARALSRLDDIEESLAPGYYGMYDDAVVMERFNITSPMGKGKMKAGQYKDLQAFMKRSHAEDITHTDLHGENIVNVLTPEGKEQAAILDWGLAGRFNNNNRLPGGNFETIQEMARGSLGRDISLKEYSKMADLKRLEAYSSGAQDMKHHVGINALMRLDEKELRDAAEEVFVHAGGKRLAPKPISETFDDWADVMSEVSTATKPENLIKRSVISGTQATVQNKLVKMQHFNNISQAAVGVGFRAAKNAKGSHGFSSTHPWN